MYSFLDYLDNDNYTFHPKQVFQLVYPSMIVNTADTNSHIQTYYGQFLGYKKCPKIKN